MEQRLSSRPFAQMVMLTLFLERNSLRLIELSSADERLLILREERLFFSQAGVQWQILIQEIKEALQKIKKSWGLSDSLSSKYSLHCILSSDFALLRVAKFEKASRFLSKAKLVQRDAEGFIPLALEKVSITYQEIGHAKCAGVAPKKIAYAAIKRDFLEEIVRAIQDAGFSIQKISLFPLSLCSLRSSKEILLLDVAERWISFLILSPEKVLKSAHFFPLSNFCNSFCDAATGLPLLLVTRLKKELHAVADIKNFSGECWMMRSHSLEKIAISLSLFLKKEFSLSSIDVDPCLLLEPTPQKSFMGSSNLIPIEKFTTPSIRKFRLKQQISFLLYLLSIAIILFSPLSLLYDHVENKKITQKAKKDSILLSQRQLELKSLCQKAEKLAGAEDAEKKLKELQSARERWPLLISELHQCAPRGIWITQLTPVVKEIKEGKGASEIIALEIKGLYLEGINGEELAHDYANKLARSPLFIAQKKEVSFFWSSKEDGTAYAYPFTIQLQLSSPIQL